MDAFDSLDAKTEECLQNCLDCHRICLETISYGLEKGEMRAEAGFIRLLLDCAEICQAGANFMTRGSELHKHVCAACAEVCARCAENCDLFADDEQMEECAEACELCAESCRDLAIA